MFVPFFIRSNRDFDWYISDMFSFFLTRIRRLFWSKVNVWGYRHFMPWQDVLDSDRLYIKDDTIILEVVWSLKCKPTTLNSIIKKSMTIRNIYIINMVYCAYNIDTLIHLYGFVGFVNISNQLNARYLLFKID